MADRRAENQRTPSPQSAADTPVPAGGTPGFVDHDTRLTLQLALESERANTEALVQRSIQAALSGVTRGVGAHAAAVQK